MKALLCALQKRFYLLMMLVIGISILLAYSLPLAPLTHILSLSLLSKEVILTLIPLIIFSCSYQCMYKLKKYGLVLLVMMIALIATSNFISSWIGFGMSKLFVSYVSLPSLESSEAAMLPAWVLTIPRLLKNEVALLLGLGLGLSSHALMKPYYADKLNVGCQKLSYALMQYCLLPILPLFMSGFIIKMVVEGTLTGIIMQCGVFALLLICIYSCYLILGYTLASNGNFKRALSAMRAILPAGWVGLSTMSSMAALPLNLKGCEKNTKHQDIVGGVLPISTNIHLIGDSIGIPMMAMMLMYSFFGHFPGIMEYSYFALLLVLAKFSVAAVPGGGIIVILPVLVKAFGFSPEMTALITMIYILLDPLITATNVMGNGLFVMVMDKVWDKCVAKKSLVQLNQEIAPEKLHATD